MKITPIGVERDADIWGEKRGNQFVGDGAVVERSGDNPNNSSGD